MANMDNFLGPPRHPSRKLSHSYTNLNASGTHVTLRVSNSNPEQLNNRRDDTRSSYFSLKFLYKITDVVLVICGAVIVLSCIAHLAICAYGFYWAG